MTIVLKRPLTDVARPQLLDMLEDLRKHLEERIGQAATDFGQRSYTLVPHADRSSVDGVTATFAAYTLIGEVAKIMAMMKPEADPNVVAEHVRNQFLQIWPYIVPQARAVREEMKRQQEGGR